MLLRVLDWILGYVTVEFIGDSVEQFMNLCAVHKKDIWDFTLIDHAIRAKVRLSEIKSLRVLARKSKVRIRIVEKHGLWFVAKPFRKRWGLLVGCVLFCFLLWFLSGRIWYINVQGNENINIQQIEEILLDVGVKQGISAKEFDWATLRQSILVRHPEISWMSFNPQGCLLQVDISETTLPPELISKQEPCNLVASRDGRIVDLKVYTGKAMVKNGDAVVKGDILISGAVEYSDGTTVFRWASGEVLAETVHKKSVFIPFEQKIKHKTGKEKVKRVFSCFGVEIPLYLGNVTQPYEKEITENYLTIRNVVLPFGVKTVRFFPTVETKVTVTKEQAKQQGVEEIQKEIENQLQSMQVKHVDYTYQTKADGVEVKSEIFCIENIIFCEKLLIF